MILYDQSSLLSASLLAFLLALSLPLNKAHLFLHLSFDNLLQLSCGLCWH
ncbi:hypothetical protein IC582_026079 [Cucumis melo]